MSIEVQRRRGSDTEHKAFTGAAGEMTYNTDRRTPHMHDGSTPYGFPVKVFLSAWDFGLAEANSAADNATALKAGLDAAHDEGGFLYIPIGVFSCAGVAIKGDLRMFGPGTLNMAGSIVIADTANVVEVYGVTLTNAPGVGVLHASTGDVLNRAIVQGVKVTGGHGFHFNAGAADVDFSGNTFKNLSQASASACQALKVGNNDYTVSLSSRRIRVYGNSVNGVVNSTGAETHAFLIYGYEITIFGNTVSGVTNSDNTGCEAIYTKGVIVSIFGNTITDCDRSNDGHITVKGTNIGETDAPNGARSSVSNNVIVNTDADENYIGIAVVTNDCVVSGNTLVNCWPRIYSCSGVQLDGNRVTLTYPGGGACFEIDGASDVHFTGNHFKLIAATADATTVTASRIRNTGAAAMTNITIKGGSFAVEYPGLTNGGSTVSPFYVWAEDGDITGVVIESVEVTVSAPSIANDADRNLVLLSGANDIGISLLRNSLDARRMLRNVMTGNLTLNVEGNRLPVTAATTANVGVVAEQTDNLFVNNGATAARNVILPDGAFPGLVYRFRATDETYGLNITIPGASSDTFTDGATSKALAVGASAEVRCYTAGLWHVEASAGTIT